MKVRGFLQDATGASRIVKMRKNKIESASENPVLYDHINEVARALHPEKLMLTVTKVKQVSPTARAFRFMASENQPVPGTRIPVFQAGQYISLRMKIGGTELTRPYSISSAPYEARGENPFVEITVRCKGEGFVQNYIYNQFKPGSEIECSMPHGRFFYEPLRDAKNVVALAGGSGITPFVSMAKEISGGKLDFNLTILYGSAVTSDIILGNEIEAISKICPKVKVVNVISNEENYEGEKGFLSAELIGKYSEGYTTYFICGPQVMYHFVDRELAKLKIKRRRIRREVFGAPKNIVDEPGFPAKAAGKIFNMKVVIGLSQQQFPAAACEPIAVALERAGIKVDTKCRSGECGFCRSQLLTGEVFVSPEEDGRRAADKKEGYFHPCSSYPVSDITVKLPILK